MWVARVLKRSDDKRKADPPITWAVSNEKPSLELFQSNGWHSASYWLPSNKDTTALRTHLHTALGRQAGKRLQLPAARGNFSEHVDLFSIRTSLGTEDSLVTLSVYSHDSSKHSS